MRAAIVRQHGDFDAVCVEVLGHVAAGRMKTVVDRTLPLAKVSEAHRLLEERRVFGKLILEP
jgi:NADPH:quinone reductase-like Zn-dependent oxidoreductase